MENINLELSGIAVGCKAMGNLPPMRRSAL